MTCARRERWAAPLGLCVFLLGCYQGEWRIGPEVAVGSQARLLPTRDVERWELEPTVTSYVVRVKGDLTQRCRTAQFGTSRRTDTGRFQRTGGKIWSGVAIGTGVVGGAMTLAPDGAYEDRRVDVTAPGNWVVWLDEQIEESVGGMSVKAITVRYPLRVRRVNVDMDQNPWGLAIDCYAAAPTLLGDAAPKAPGARR